MSLRYIEYTFDEPVDLDYIIYHCTYSANRFKDVKIEVLTEVNFTFVTLLWEALKSARVELALSNVPSYTFTYSAVPILLIVLKM